MRSRLICLVFVQFAFFFSLSTQLFALSEQAQEDLATLKKIPANYLTFGTVCEEVAKMRYEKEYSQEQYDVLGGIEYRDRNRVLGELDVVVFERSSNEAILIAEVKCWDDPEKALDKAKEQLNRFEQAVSGRKIRDMYLTDGEQKHFEVGQFDQQLRTDTVTYDGAESAGFDRSIGLSMDDVKELRQELLKCQASGKCPSPRNAGGQRPQWLDSGIVEE